MSEDVSLVRVATSILRYRRIVIVSAALLAATVVVATLVASRTYTARASVMSQAESGRLAGFAALAAQVGFALPRGEADVSPAFYASLLTSREVLEQAVTSEYAFPLGGQTVKANLVTLYRASGKDSVTQLEVAVRRLREALRVGIDRETGIIEVNVRAVSPVLAESVLDRLLHLLSEFDQGKRQSRASAERKFVEARIHEADSSLKAAELRLETFLQQNREFRSAPHLTFTHDRLQRAVTMQQQVYTGLAQAYEQARLDEVRNTPILTIVERPRAGRRPDPRWLLLKTALALMVGTALGTLVALARDAFTAEGERTSTEVAEFDSVREEALEGIRHAARRVKGVAGSSRADDTLKS